MTASSASSDFAIGFAFSSALKAVQKPAFRIFCNILNFLNEILTRVSEASPENFGVLSCYMTAGSNLVI